MLITISGPSSIGKDSVWLKAAEKLGYPPFVAYTTRPQREGEVNGVDYHYISRKAFQNKIRRNELAEWDYVLGNYYGTDKALIDKVNSGQNFCLVVLARMGIRLKRHMPDTLSLMLSTDNNQILNNRLKARGYKGVELNMRIEHGHSEMALAPLFNQTVPDAEILTLNDALRVLARVLAEHES